MNLYILRYVHQWLNQCWFPFSTSHTRLWLNIFCSCFSYGIYRKRCSILFYKPPIHIDTYYHTYTVLYNSTYYIHFQPKFWTEIKFMFPQKFRTRQPNNSHAINLTNSFKVLVVNEHLRSGGNGAVVLLSVYVCALYCCIYIFRQTYCVNTYMVKCICM